MSNLPTHDLNSMNEGVSYSMHKVIRLT